MRRLSNIAILLCVLGMVVPLLLATPAHALGGYQEPDHEFTVAVGETLTFSGRSVHRIVHGDASVAEAQSSGDGRFLFVQGKSPGTTTIVFFTGGDEQQTLLIRVVGVNPNSLAEEVREVLGEGAGVDIRVVAGRVLIEGEVSSRIFQEKIDRLTELYPNQVLNFATYREAFVEGARMVAMDVYFIQLATTRQDGLGVRWNQFIGGNVTTGTGDVPLYYDAEELGPGVLPGSDSPLPPRPMALTGGEGMTSYSSLVGNLNFALDFLVEQGMIKTVQQATLVTEAGTEAEYLSGGTLLIPITTQTTQGFQERAFGLELNVRPILDFENRVKLEVNLSYSEVDFALGVEGMPGLRTNDITSTVNMQEGQSVLISAQENIDNTSTERGIAMLQQIPILGWAFKSRSLISEELNNALFITPRVYEPGSDYHRTLVRGVFTDLMDAGAHADDLPELEDR